MSSYEAAPAAEEVAPADEVADGTASDGEGVDESNEIDPLSPLVDVADGSDQGASAPMLPSGFTSPHLVLEVLSLLIGLFVLNLAYFAFRYFDAEDATIEAGGNINLAAEEYKDDFYQFVAFVTLYVGFSMYIVVATALATCQGFRMCCCHCCDKGDCCNSAASAGHMTYLISIVCALVLSYFELEYCLDQHTALASSECDYGCVDGTCSGLPATFDGATGSAMQVEILHHLLGLVSAWATVKFAFRMLALIGTLQRMCCSKKSLVKTAQLGCTKDMTAITIVGTLGIGLVVWLMVVSFVNESSCKQPCLDVKFQECYSADACTASQCHMCAKHIKDAEEVCGAAIAAVEGDAGSEIETCPLDVELIKDIRSTCGNLFFNNIAAHGLSPGDAAPVTTFLDTNGDNLPDQMFEQQMEDEACFATPRDASCPDMPTLPTYTFEVHHPRIYSCGCQTEVFSLDGEA